MTFERHKTPRLFNKVKVSQNYFPYLHVYTLVVSISKNWRGSKWLPSQFKRKPQVTMIFYQTLSTLGGFSDRTMDRICFRSSSRAECEIRAQNKIKVFHWSVRSLITIKLWHALTHLLCRNRDMRGFAGSNIVETPWVWHRSTVSVTRT